MGDSKVKHSLPINRPHSNKRKKRNSPKVEVWYRWGKMWTCSFKAWYVAVAEIERSKVREAESNRSPAHWLGLADTQWKSWMKRNWIQKEGTSSKLLLRSGTQQDLSVVHKHLQKNCSALNNKGAVLGNGNSEQQHRHGEGLGHGRAVLQQGQIRHYWHCA